MTPNVHRTPLCSLEIIPSNWWASVAQDCVAHVDVCVCVVLTLVLLQSLPKVQLQLHISLHTLLQYFGHSIPILQRDIHIEYYSKHLIGQLFEYFQDSFSHNSCLQRTEESYLQC